MYVVVVEVLAGAETGAFRPSFSSEMRRPSEPMNVKGRTPPFAENCLFMIWKCPMIAMSTAEVTQEMRTHVSVELIRRWLLGTPALMVMPPKQPNWTHAAT